jgi:hypothetical protein
MLTLTLTLIRENGFLERLPVGWLAGCSSLALLQQQQQNRLLKSDKQKPIAL